MGHRQRLLVDPQTGVYRYDQLLVLRDTSMPAVLLEAGSIINREEELRMGSVEQQSLISAAVVDAVQSFCAARGARTPPRSGEPQRCGIEAGESAGRRDASTDSQATLIRRRGDDRP